MNSYYAIQCFMSTHHLSDLDKIWKTIGIYGTLDRAHISFKNYWLSEPSIDYRIVHAFIDPSTQKEMVLEILHFKKGEPE